MKKFSLVVFAGCCVTAVLLVLIDAPLNRQRVSCTPQSVECEALIALCTDGAYQDVLAELPALVHIENHLLALLFLDEHASSAETLTADLAGVYRESVKNWNTKYGITLHLIESGHYSPQIHEAIVSDIAVAADDGGKDACLLVTPQIQLFLEHATENDAELLGRLASSPSFSTWHIRIDQKLEAVWGTKVEHLSPAR